jgi:hypothetical protein
MDGFSSFFSVNKMKYNKQAGRVVRVALTAFNKSSIYDLMMQKAVGDRIHTLVGDVVPSNAVVSQVSALLADHSQSYDTSGKPRSDLFVVDANPNISVFSLLMTYSLLHVLGKHNKSFASGGGTCIGTFSHKWQ